MPKITVGQGTRAPTGTFAAHAQHPFARRPAEMNLLSVEKLAKRYGPHLLFEDISFGLEKGGKTAIVARNGSGKSTLLKCIAGIEQPDSGTVAFNKGIRVGYLDQNVAMTGTHSIVDEMLDKDDPLTNAVRAYEHALAPGTDGRVLQQALARMEELGAWSYEARVKSLLHRFGLRDMEQAVGTLSGGQQKRLAMAKVLIDMPDLLILDEPTNHLDMPMIEQLEEELAAPQTTLLLVTHDRYFLDAVCDGIIELEHGVLTRYKGNYSAYVERKAMMDEVREATQQHLRGLMRRELEWVRRMPRARGTKSKSRLDKFEDIKAEATKRYDRDDVRLEVKTDRIGGKVIEVRNLTKAFGTPADGDRYKPIVQHFNYSFKKGDRVGIVGPNGIGKSTFLDLLTKRTAPDMGKVTIGDTVVLGIFDQRGLQVEEDKRIIEVVRDIAETIPLNKGRTLSASQLLERFLFDKDQQYQYVSTLSGGERRRLYLCTVLMRNPNLLVLDEPTNDLDIPTLNALEDFLTELDAVLLIVSHDRFFVDKVCNKLLYFEGEGVIKEWVGSYTDLHRRRRTAARQEAAPPPAARADAPAAPAGGTKPKARKLTWAEARELERIDLELPVLEERKEQLNASLMEAGVGHEEIARRSLELEEVVRQVDRMTDRWLELSEKSA